MSIFASMSNFVLAILLFLVAAAFVYLVRRLDSARIDLQSSIAESARLRAERDAARDEVRRIQETESERSNHLRAEIELLSQRIFDDKTSRFKEMGVSAIAELVAPVRENLEKLQKSLTESERADAVREQSLKEALERVAQINGSLGAQAERLALALRGDNKLVGDFGEILLGRLLEFSGLRKGVHYVEQGEGMGLRDSTGRHLLPDVVVFLPDDRCLVIDSKTSLSSWVDAQSQDPEVRGAALSSLTRSVRSHASDLASKPYTEALDAAGRSSLDFKLLFIPVESAFQACLANDPELYADAFGQRIILVSPTTLLAVLATVEHTWKQWDIGRNARRIADRAGLMLEKLSDALGSVELVGSHLEKAHASWEEARFRLATGRGNLVSQARKLKELGARSDKPLPRSLEALTDSDTLEE